MSLQFVSLMRTKSWMTTGLVLQLAGDSQRQQVVSTTRDII